MKPLTIGILLFIPPIVVIGQVCDAAAVNNQPDAVTNVTVRPARLDSLPRGETIVE